MPIFFLSLDITDIIQIKFMEESKEELKATHTGITKYILRSYLALMIGVGTYVSSPLVCNIIHTEPTQQASCREVLSKFGASVSIGSAIFSLICLSACEKISVKYKKLTGQDILEYK